MKIAYVLDDTLDKSDGVQQAVITIAEHVRKLGHDVHYIVPQTTRTDLKNIHCISRFVQLKFNGNSVRTPLPAPRSQVKALLKREQFDVLHVQMPYSPLLAGRVIRAAHKNTRVVGTFHILPYNTFAKVGTRLLGIWLSRNLRRFDTTYAVSEPAQQFMQASFGIRPDVLGNPIQYEFFHRYAHDVLKKPPMKNIIYVGRFDKRKGVLQLLMAYRQMENQATCSLIMCGKGPLLEDAKRYAEQHKLNVTFPGFVSEEEKASYLSNATLAVFPSISGESFGIVLTEAMASGAQITLGGNNPGYASVLGAWPEVLFDPNNTEEFAKKLNSFLSDHSKRILVGKAQSEFVKSFDVQYVCKTLLEEAYLKK